MAKGASAETFTDHWHCYQNIGVAVAWNHYRTLRILVNRIVVTELAYATEDVPTSLSSLFPSLQDQVESSRSMIFRLSHEICASVPFFLRHDQHNLGSRWSSAYQPQNAARGRILIRPLFVAGQPDNFSDIMRLWVAARLENIAEVMGLRRAKVLARVFRTQQNPAWLGIKDKRGWQELDAEK